MKKWLLAALTLIAASCAQPALNLAGAQNVTKAQLDSVKADIADIKAALGSFTVKPRTRSEPGGSACTETPSGECQVFYSLREIRLALDPIVAAYKSAPAPSSSVQVVPAAQPAGASIPGLSAQQIADAVQCLTDGVNAGYPIATTRDRVRSELAAGVYSYGVRSIIDDAKLWYYSGLAGANKTALVAYLQIIDQRDPANPNVTLSAGDPRWKRVGTPQPVAPPAQFANSVSGDLYVSGRIIVGSCAHPDGNALVQVCGQGDGGIQLESGVGGSKPAIGMLSLGGDHGLRLLQNAYTSVNTHPAYDPVGNVNYQSNLIEGVDPNYPQGIFGGDSQARWSWQVKAPGLSHDYTQDIALGINEATKEITLESWRPGWHFTFITSSGFRTIDRRFTVPTQ